MKFLRNSILQLLIFSFFSNATKAQLKPTIHIVGTHIIGPCGDTLQLRGINYAPYNWGWDNTELNIDQVALSGSNCVRIPWYKANPNAVPSATYNNLTYLDSALSKCIQYKMIPILELHDQTCQNDSAALSLLTDWYIQSAVVSLINKYKHSLIINIANEALFVSWTANPAIAKIIFTNTYASVVSKLRSNGITVPLMIDGPDCGANLDALSDVGAVLQAADPEHNLLFSAHGYWYGFAGNDSLTMRAKIDNALSKNIPFIFGEIANQQDDATPCQFNLNYKALLNICTEKNLGWLAWSWDHDICSDRQISTDGTFIHLTPYGNDILNNKNYGLLTHSAAKSKFLTNSSCSTSSLLEINKKSSFSIYPNPSNGTFSILSATTIKMIEVMNLLGQKFEIIKQAENKFSFKFPTQGFYIIHFVDNKDQSFSSLLTIE